MPGRPRVIAHRGASADVAEHTVAAYRQAIAEGADGLECDVRLTRDGVLVCVHDRTVDRTSSGRGSVSAFDLGELSELDFGILTLASLLDLLEESDRPLELAIETKHPTRYAGLVEATLVALLRNRGLIAGRHRLRVMSFSTTGLRRARMLEPQLQTVLLCKRVPLRLRDGVLPPSVDVAGPSLFALRVMPEFVGRVHRAGGEVHVWTVDDPADIEYVTGLGVDAVITNRPALALDLVGRPG